MENQIKRVFQNSFYQLLAVYTILIVLVSLNLFWKYTLHFEIFAVILGILGISLISGYKDEKFLNKKLHYGLFTLAILFIIFFRIIPYINNVIPIGYDAGIYKYAIESFYKSGFGIDDWVKGSLSPGFLYLSFPLVFLFSSKFILIWLFILFNLILGISIYFVTKEYFNKEIALISLLLYAVSFIQFKVFSFLYYKNIIALSLMLWTLYFLKKENRTLFIIFGALLGAMHRPSFFVFGLVYILWTAYNYKKWKVNVVNGVLILGLTALFYIGFFKQAIFPLILPVAKSFVSSGHTGGSFLNFFTYQFSSLFYLPFAILGFFYLIKNKKFNILFFWGLVNACIVYFQFSFYNRFIIHLDIVLIIFASLGFFVLIKNKKIFGTIILILMLSLASFVTFNEANKTNPGISNEQLELIKSLNEVEESAFVISVSSEYSPWVLGYSNRKTIAPGLFSENKWSKAEWGKFWASHEKEETQELVSVYEKPIYLFAGNKDFDNLCFKEYLEKAGNKIYKYIC